MPFRNCLYEVSLQTDRDTCGCAMAASGIEVDQRELQRCSSPTIMSPLCVLHSLVRLNTDENADAEFPFWFGIRVLNGSRGGALRLFWDGARVEQIRQVKRVGRVAQEPTDMEYLLHGPQV